MRRQARTRNLEIIARDSGFVAARRPGM